MKVFTQTGGARIGRSFWLSMNASVPFAKLQVTENEITLNSMGKKYSFGRNQIEALSIYSGAISSGLQIHHLNAKYPKFIVYWTLDLPSLKTHLSEFGYELS